MWLNRSDKSCCLIVTKWTSCDILIKNSNLSNLSSQAPTFLQSFFGAWLNRSKNFVTSNNSKLTHCNFFLFKISDLSNIYDFWPHLLPPRIASCFPRFAHLSPPPPKLITTTYSLLLLCKHASFALFVTLRLFVVVYFVLWFGLEGLEGSREEAGVWSFLLISEVFCSF